MFTGGFFSSGDLKDLAKALSETQGELSEAVKGSQNTFFKRPDGKPSTYADLAEVLQTIRPVAAKHGLCYIQGAGFNHEAGVVLVTTRIMHTSGQWIQSELGLPINKKDAQGVGAAITYGRRYALAAMFGIAQEDDDGNTASSAPPASTKAPRKASAESDVKQHSKVADILVKRFDEVLGPEHADEMKALTDEYLTLTPSEQTQVLGAAKAARIRLDAAKQPAVH